VSEVLAAAGIPCGPCYDAEEVLADEHLAQRDMLVRFDHGDGSSYVVPGNPVRLSRIEPPADRRSPTLGEDTDAVLHELLGIEGERLDALRSSGVIR